MFFIPLTIFQAEERMKVEKQLFIIIIVNFYLGSKIQHLSMKREY